MKPQSKNRQSVFRILLAALIFAACTSHAEPTRIGDLQTVTSINSGDKIVVQPTGGHTSLITRANLASSLGSGTVTSVGITLPSGFTVSSSPVTTSGTIAVTTSLSGVLKGTGTGFAAAVSGTDFLAPGVVGSSGLTMNTSRLLGRWSASSGAVQEITLGSGLSLSGSGVLSATSSFDQSAVAITGGTITGTPISGSTGSFTQVVAAPGSAGAPALAWANYADSGFYSPAAAAGGYAVNGVCRQLFGGATFRIGADMSFSWTDNADASSGTTDLQLVRDAANTLALRNGANAQTLNVYNTYTDASNFERVRVGNLGSNFAIQVEQAGTGTARTLQFLTTGSSDIEFYTASNPRWTINAAGNLVAQGAYSITAGGTVTASAFAGDGSGLTGLFNPAVPGPIGGTTPNTGTFTTVTADSASFASGGITATTSNGGTVQAPTVLAPSYMSSTYYAFGLNAENGGIDGYFANGACKLRDSTGTNAVVLRASPDTLDVRTADNAASGTVSTKKVVGLEQMVFTSTAGAPDAISIWTDGVHLYFRDNTATDHQLDN